MIVVVEGVSASGKSTWCAQHGDGRVIPENGRLNGISNRTNDPVGAAQFWAERNADRWQSALAIERDGDLAVCDTDPLKLHYIWCLWQIGMAEERDWCLELTATRETVREKRIGFADCYIVGHIDPELARKRAQMDKTRQRRQFELHVRLQKPLMQWYSALDRAVPGRVQFGFPSERPMETRRRDRYDLAAFDRLIAELPNG